MSSAPATIREKDGWLAILKDRLEPAIAVMPETSATEMDRKKQVQQVRAHLHAVRIAWRNDTMHPKATYTEEEAKELLGHVLAFLRHLALIT